MTKLSIYLSTDDCKLLQEEMWKDADKTKKPKSISGFIAENLRFAYKKRSEVKA